MVRPLNNNMKLFNSDKFYIIVDKGGEVPAFATFGSSGGFRRCDSVVQASKFKELNNALESASKLKELTVFCIERTEKSNLVGPSGTTHWETWTWKEVDK